MNITAKYQLKMNATKYVYATTLKFECAIHEAWHYKIYFFHKCLYIKEV